MKSDDLQRRVHISIYDIPSEKGIETTHSDTLQLSTYEPVGMFSVPAQTRFRDPTSVVRASNSFINLRRTISTNQARCMRGNVLHLDALDAGGVTRET